MSKRKAWTQDVVNLDDDGAEGDGGGGKGELERLRSEVSSLRAALRAERSTLVFDVDAGEVLQVELCTSPHLSSSLCTHWL